MSKATSPQLAPGTVIDGMYTIGESLRSRVGAVTYAATDPNDKKVEVTVYRPDCFMNPMALERSLRELRQVSTVDDPRVVHVFDSGKMKDGGVYEVHEHVDGKTIAELGAQSGEDASKILQEVVAALLAAGKAGVLHRDLGPDVVLRAADGAVKVGGFAVGEPQGGVSFGAIECIAPEQVEGKNIDEATLVYNLAALGYRILHGRAVFVGDVATQLLQHAASVPPADVDPALAPGLAKDPKSRPAGLAVFGGQIGRLASAPAKPAGGPIAKGGGFGPLPGAKPAGGAAKLPGLGAPPAAAAGRAPLGPLPGAPRPAAPAPAGAPKPPAGPGLPPIGAPSAGPKPGAKPRTRGWTMFMEATDDEVSTIGKAPGAPAPTPPAAAPVAAAPVAAAPVAPPVAAAPVAAAPVAPPVAAAPVAAPSAVPPVAAPAPTPAASPAAASKMPTLGAPPKLGAPPTLGAPTLGAPVAAPTLAAPVAASTLGAPVAAPSLGAPVAAPSLGAPVPAPSLGAPVAAPTPAAAPAAPIESKPSVRGWTMIMDDPDEAAAATPQVAPAAPAAPAAPSTRGWTMLEELNESPAVADVSTPVGAGVPMPAEQAAATAAPTSRGWTMFMEAELEGEKAAAPAVEPEPEFFDGAVTTESGTVIAFAPEAPTRRATPVPKPLPQEEPMTSFASRLRGEDEPVSSFAAKLRGDEEPAESLEELAQATAEAVSSPQISVPKPAEVPSFAGPSSLDVVPSKPDLSPIAAPVERTDEEEVPQGGSSKMLIVVIVLVALAAAAYFILK